GALLAGAAIVFITLVGVVSFNVWPKSKGALGVSNVELQAATNPAHHQIVASTQTGSAPPVVTVPSTSGAAGATAPSARGGAAGHGGEGGKGGGAGPPRGPRHRDPGAVAPK